MLVVRLSRVGKKNQPSFKIVVTDKRRSSRAGRFVEEVGFYNPLTKEKVLKSERLKYWLSVGAKPSATVHNLLISEKITEGKKIPKHKKAKGPASAKASAFALRASTDKPAGKPASAEVQAVKEEKPTEAPAAPEKPAEEKPAEKKTEEVRDVLPSETSVEEEAPKTEISNKEISETSK